MGCPSQKLPIVSRQANERKKLDGQDRKPKPHEMGLQVPRRVHTEEEKKSVVRTAAGAFGRGVSHAGAAQGKPDRRGACDARSRAYAHCDTAEICRVASRGVYRGEKRDTPGAGVWREQEELYRAELLGARVLCLHGGAGCADDPELHPAPGRGGCSTGVARSVEVRGHRCGGAKSWGRVSVPV